tara:strand:+ start:292 stop:486 length:195 start_codon:yes stop_codon:yes gene_type:complete
MTEFETMVKKQEQIDQLQRCIKGLKIYFDYATIDITKMVVEQSYKKVKQFTDAQQWMFNNFNDE